MPVTNIEILSLFTAIVSRGVHFGAATMTEFPRDAADDDDDSASDYGADDVIKDANLFPYQVSNLTVVY